MRRAWLMLLVLPLTCLGWISSPPPPRDSYTVVGPGSLTIGGQAYDFGGYRIQRAGKTLLIAKETGAAFFDVVSADSDVSLYYVTDGSFVSAGPTYGARLYANNANGVSMYANAGPAVVQAAASTVTLRGSTQTNLISDTADIVADAGDSKAFKIAIGTRFNFPVLSATPTTKVAGDVWMLDSGVTHQLQWYTGSATYQVTGTVVP